MLNLMLVQLQINKGVWEIDKEYGMDYMYRFIYEKNQSR